jgi:hypothetical protein
MPVVGSPHASEDPKIRNALIALRNTINGNLDADNLANGAVTADKLADALAKALGIDNAAVDGRGFSQVATSQSTSSASYVDLGTAGPSVSIDVPADGFVAVYAEATLTPSSTGAAIVGLQEATDLATPKTILTLGANLSAQTLATDPGTITGVDKSVTPGGLLLIPATAGRRTYKLQYARFAGSGNVTFANRKLWVIGGGPA